MSADKRSVQTDALAVLGTIIDDTVGRDAIHLAVEPVTAGETLRPGERIVLAQDDKSVAIRAGTDKALGLVDPFLTDTVKHGQRFLMVLLPGQIATLRHVWDHPAFPPAQVGGVELGVPPAAQPTDAKTWLENFAREQSTSFPELLRSMFRWSEFDEEPWWWGSNLDAEYDTLWTKFEELVGTPMSRGEIDFSCRGC